MQAIFRRKSFIVGGSIVFFAGQVLAGQPLETESARMLPHGAMKFEGSVEWQTSSDGQEVALPLVFDYGISDRLELSLEPVAYTRIHPKIGTNSSGIGDFEATLKWLAMAESEHRPALAFGAEVKIPTAKNRQIGTGKTDFRGFVAVSRRIDQWDLHANAGYTVLGKPTGLAIDNIFDYALAAEFHVSDQLTWLAEITGHTSATGEAPDSGPVVPVLSTSENPLAPELASNETIGMVGARYLWRPGAALTLGLTYDNNNAFSIRPGVSIRW